MNFAASPEQVWGGLMFYEQIEEPPPLHLRLLLPMPIRTEGSKSAVGDEAMCLYEGGHLLKRVTQIDPCRHYGFEVVEQNLAVGGGMIAVGRLLHAARASGPPHRGRGHDPLREPQASRLAVEADRGDRLPPVPPPPPRRDAAQDRVTLSSPADTPVPGACA